MLDDVACAADEAAPPFRTDKGIDSRTNRGLLVCETEQTVEAEFRALLPSAGVDLRGARIHDDVVVTWAMLHRMRDDIPVATGLLPPGVDLDVIGLARTSGAIGIQRSTAVTPYSRAVNERLRDSSAARRRIRISAMASLAA